MPFVINARTDVVLREAGAPGERVEAAVARGRAYLERGTFKHQPE